MTQILVARLENVALEPIRSITVDISGRAGFAFPADLMINSKKVKIGSGNRGEAIRTYVSDVRTLFAKAVRVAVTIDPENGVLKGVRVIKGRE